MPLTEAQRLAFLKGREKRMANIEKAKLEKAEKAEMEQMIPPPPKPKVTRKPRKTKEVKEEPVPAQVKTDPDPDPSEAATEPETDPDEPVKTSQTPVSETKAPSTPAYYEFDQDAFANKIVNMLVQKGMGYNSDVSGIVPPKPKKLKPSKPAVKKTTTNRPGTPTPTPTIQPSFNWM